MSSNGIKSRETGEFTTGRKVKVIVVGAGVGGILCGIRLPQHLPAAELVIYEKNKDIGGTWYENRYPGVACDIPSHSYQATFEPNPDWSTFYASGHEILRYWHGVAEKYGVRKYVVPNSKVEKATWNEQSANWTVEVRNTVSGKVVTDIGDYIICAYGLLNDWQWPKIKGLHEFKGKLLHTADWDESYDYSDKNVAVVGNGSSGIQVVPAIMSRVRRIDHYVRGKTWIAPGFVSEEFTKDGCTSTQLQFPAELREKFRNDKDFYLDYRKGIENKLSSIHGFVYPGTTLYNLLGNGVAKHMESRLGSHQKLMDQLRPSFSPGCRRLTPGPGYLEAIVDPKVNYITDPISEINPTGIVTTDGVNREVDAIFCATGFNTSYTGRFPVYGRNGMTIDGRWSKYPETYLGVCTNEFPNLFFILGPNTGPSTGSLLLVVEKQVEFIAAMLQKAQRDAIVMIEPKKTSVENFSEYCHQYFPKTIFMEDCRAWYKSEAAGNRVTALWPGSTLHQAKVLKNPRWEDFQYEHLSNNTAAWLGDGWTIDEKLQGGNRSWHLDSENIDFPPQAERFM
ncbi:cyclohexanone monooxygenase [Cadophora sp. DSE1049]|nr:cyclohexanone monooxygenase [Cadophora sp. DSE1049]